MINSNSKIKFVVIGSIAVSLLLWGISFYKRPVLKEIMVEKESKKVALEPQKQISQENKVFYPERVRVKDELSDEENQKKDKEIEELVNKLTDLDINISQNAADELVKFGSEAVKGLLDKLEETTDVGLKGEIIFILGRIGNKEAVPTLRGILNYDDNAYIRRNAAESLGKIKDESAIYDLTRALSDEDISVRERSAWSLGELKDSRAVNDILISLGTEKDEGVKSQIVRTLGEIKQESASLVLVKELKSQNDSLYKNEVVFSLGEIGNADALSDLTEYLDKLKALNPTENMVIFQWKESIRIAEEAIGKIKMNSNL